MVLNEVWQKIKKIIDIENITKILIDIGEILANYITLKDVFMLTTWVITENGRYYP